MNQITLKTSSQELEKQSETVIAELPKEGIRSIFHLLVGKPDSIERVFKRRILIEKKDLLILHDKMAEKLNNHNIEAVNITIDITYDDDETVQFGSWPQFIESDLNREEKIINVKVRFDFLVNLPLYKFPQRHTVTITILSTGLSHSFIESMMSKMTSDEKEDRTVIKIGLGGVFGETIPMTCRVDFVNNILSRELLNLISEWHSTLVYDEIEKSFFSKVRENRDKISPLIKYSIPLSFLLVFFSYHFNYTRGIIEGATATVSYIDHVYYLTIISLFVVFIGIKISNWISDKTNNKLKYYNMRHHTFKITSGDILFHKKIQKNNKSIIRDTLISYSVSLILNILAGIIVFYMFNASVS